MSITTPIIAVHYAEIALKGKNRSMFLRKLKNNMDHALIGLPVEKINHIESRILVTLHPEADVDEAVTRLKRVFGIQWLSAATPIDCDDVGDDLSGLVKLAIDIVKNDIGDAKTFRVTAKRSDKNFHKTSLEIEQHVGGEIHEVIQVPAKMKNPDYTLNILVLKERILLFSNKIRCFGGLPVGSSGKLMSLLSGGIDSPVASWMMMKRGCTCEFVHFHTGRSIAEASVEKIEKMVMVLAQYSPRPLRVRMVPVYPYEVRAIGNVEDKYDMLLFRRFIFKTASRLAWRRNCHAIVAGDSVGQVASQTLPNLKAIAPDVQLPVLRPLIGMDKLEITDLSRKTGLFETSILPYRDCCSIRSPRPELNARSEVLMKFSDKIELEDAVTEAIKTSVVLKIGPEGRITE
ncbi:tRNA 4-thiouridine(8) synthase ThiI [bacterium]|nr:tRNA 4-thiouridine(8) synthase ThiI [bacterium]